MMWSEAMLDILKAAGYCAVAALLAPFAWSVLRWTLVHPAAVLYRELKSLPPVPRVLAVLVLCVSIVFGDKPSTNGTDSADAPLLGGARMTMRSPPPRPSSVRRLCVSSLPFSDIDEDVVDRGWRMVSVVTNETEMPVSESAVRCERWHRTGGASKFDFFKLPVWLFPYGTNLCDTVTAFNDGSLAIDFGPGCPRLAATPDQVYPVPFSSEFLAWGDARTMTFLWNDYSLCATDASARVDVRIDLRADGKFVVSSNCVSWLCRRIEPFDWDGDGLPNDVDVDPFVPNGDCFGPHQVLPSSADTNAYYWVDVVSPFEDALVTFIGDAPSNLPDPRFVAKAGDTNRVVLLIGKYYSVESTRPLELVGSETDVVVEPDGCGGTSVCWPVFAEADEDGRDFTMSVIPSRVVGEFVWDESCCRISGAGRSFSFACNGACLCTGCLAEGELRYEGYSIPVCGGWCPCEYGLNPPFPEPEGEDGPYAASVSLSLSAPVVIFEDAYTNRPGEVVSRRSTATRLSGVAHGGPNGGTLSLSVTNGTKITLTRGVPITSPVTVPAGQKFEFAAEYEGVAASAAEGDVVFTATFTENGVGSSHESSASLTAVRLQLEAVYEAPENPNPSRHLYGVGEKVRFTAEPALPDIAFRTSKLDVEDGFYGYELFDDESTNVNASAARIYQCPISANYHPPLAVCLGDVEYYRPEIQIVEPQEVITPGASWGENAVDFFYEGNRKCWPDGEVGSACLVTTNYIGPMYVSFQGVSVSEVPCNSDDEDVVTGCFMNLHARTHTIDAGAGKGYYITAGNFWFVDGARQSRPETNWSSNSCLSWKIPVGWHRIHQGGEGFHSAPKVDYESYDTVTTRELIIGGSRDRYKQVWTVDADGTFRTDKFGHWISRSRYCRVVLDGTVLQTRHKE